jgi:hypothetical protein
MLPLWAHGGTVGKDRHSPVPIHRKKGGAIYQPKVTACGNRFIFDLKLAKQPHGLLDNDRVSTHPYRYHAFLDSAGNCIAHP